MPEDASERVIPGTLRPDGTVRKAIRVRAGYVPLEEQPIYQSRGAKFRDAAKSHVPGMDPAALEAAKAANANSLKSKAAKKNEKRKEKRVARKPSTTEMPSGEQNDGLESSMQRLDLAHNSGDVTVPCSEDADAEAAKQIRALKKKLRQCEALKRDDEAGETLTDEECRKLNSMSDWQQQLEQLER